MHYYIANENDTQFSFFCFSDEALETSIGSGEGVLSNNNELLSVIKVNKEYQKQGYGFIFFEKIFHYFEKKHQVEGIVGSWHKDSEFSYVDGGQSTNKSVYEQLRKLGHSKEFAALNTPTGKWAAKLGYKTLKITIENEFEIYAIFKK